MHTGSGEPGSSSMLKAVVDVPAGTVMATLLPQPRSAGIELKNDEIDPGLDGLCLAPVLPAPVLPEPVWPEPVPGEPSAPSGPLGWLPDRVAAGWPFAAEPVTQPATASARITTPVTLSRASIDLQRRSKTSLMTSPDTYEIFVHRWAGLCNRVSKGRGVTRPDLLVACLVRPAHRGWHRAADNLFGNTQNFAIPK